MHVTEHCMYFTDILHNSTLQFSVVLFINTVTARIFMVITHWTMNKTESSQKEMAPKLLLLSMP